MTETDLLTLFRALGRPARRPFPTVLGAPQPRLSAVRPGAAAPRDAEALGAALGKRVRSLGAVTVLSPALGGIVIGQEVGRALGVRALFAEREDGTLTLRRGFAIAATERVLVVEDVVTTGGSTRETMEVARAAGAIVVGACAIVDRSGGNHGLDVPFSSLLPMVLPDLPARGLPPVRTGSGRGEARLASRRGKGLT